MTLEQISFPFSSLNNCPGKGISLFVLLKAFKYKVGWNSKSLLLAPFSLMSFMHLFITLILNASNASCVIFFIFIDYYIVKHQIQSHCLNPFHFV